MTIPAYHQTDLFSDHLTPIGAPCVTERIIVGYPCPIDDPLLWSLLAEQPQGMYVERLILDALESKHGKFSLKTDYLFEVTEPIDHVDEIHVSEASASLAMWASHLEHELVRFRISDHYHLLKNRLYHDYASIDPHIDFYRDKCVIRLCAFHPDAE